MTISIKINIDEKTGELTTNLNPINHEKDIETLKMLANIVNEFTNKSASHAVKNNVADDDDFACDYENKMLSFIDTLNSITKKSNSYDFLNDKAEMVVDNIADEISDLIRSCFPSNNNEFDDEDEFEDDYFDSFPPELSDDTHFKSLFEAMLLDDEDDDVVIEDDEEDFHPRITVSNYNNLFDDPITIKNYLDFIEYKGFDIKSVEGLKSARIWLESAEPDELFYGDPTGDPMDICMGELRKPILINVVEKEIKRLSEI